MKKVQKNAEVNNESIVQEVNLLRSDWLSVDEKLASFIKANGDINKSQQIRYLLSLNWGRSHIAKKLNIIYQHVRNVEIQPIKKANLLIDEVKIAE